MNSFISPRLVLDAEGKVWTINAADPATFPDNVFAQQGVNDAKLVWNEAGRWVSAPIPHFEIDQFEFAGNRIPDWI